MAYLFYENASAGPLWASTSADDTFQFFNACYEPSGGLLCGDDLASMDPQRDPNRYAQIARRIAANEALSFKWHSVLWLPAFQLDSRGHDVRPEVSSVVRELNAALDGDEILEWFVAPNVWLDGDTPVDVMNFRPVEVRDAARAQRFALRG